MNNHRIGIEPILSSEVWRFNPRGIASLGRLFQELSPYRQRALGIEDFVRLADESECLLAVDLSQNGAIVGTARVVVRQHESVGHYGVIHDVVVDRNHRGQGIGKALMLKSIELGRQLHLRYVDALVKLARVEFNRRCESLGFELISSPSETGGVNHYRLML